MPAVLASLSNFHSPMSLSVTDDSANMRERSVHFSRFQRENLSLELIFFAAANILLAD